MTPDHDDESPGAHTPETPQERQARYVGVGIGLLLAAATPRQQEGEADPGDDAP